MEKVEEKFEREWGERDRNFGEWGRDLVMLGLGFSLLFIECKI